MVNISESVSCLSLTKVTLISFPRSKQLSRDLLSFTTCHCHTPKIKQVKTIFHAADPTFISIFGTVFPRQVL